ncbi:MULTISPECIES: winged helix-turn-helix domain-containing protein [Aeromonas]|uniref:winged helix-turn-helix domain-containing protein n=1 Tax=Aeromonas TaxID=642 RepID=UPI000C75EBB5|nr:helix-turn-helix domain-containing protein [Aeromonas veronii]AYK16934.1 helix-turn-helix domain-containing protein [Aeromonas veronii]
MKLTHTNKKLSFCLNSGIVHYKAIDGTSVNSRLGKKDCDVLAYLIKNEGRLITREELLSKIWKDRVVGYNTVSVSLSNIRQFIKKVDEDCLCLINISGKGYVFNPERSGLEVKEDCETQL